MSIPGAASPLFLATTAGAADAFSVAKSLRFNGGDSAHLNRTPSAAGNRKTWTWSAWVKLSTASGANNLFAAYNSSFSIDNFIQFYIDGNSGKLGVYGTALLWESNQVFRDPSAWYHFVIAFDTTQSTADDRLKIYVNNLQLTKGSGSGFSQDTNYAINNNIPHRIGTYSGGSEFFNGLMAEINFIDGQALAPTDFGETDDNGVWQAKEFTGTYGTNGFRLPFTDNSSNQALGYDAAVTAPTLNPKGGMDVVTYTGNGGTQSVGGLAFQPDFVWIKSRSNSSSHHLFDVVRGGTKALYSDSTSTENTASNYITSFSPDGFGLGNETGINGSSRTYAAWCWKAAGAAVSNTDGTITSQVSASTDYGFSVVTYTGNATQGASVGHGLSTAPSWIIVKRRDSSANWAVGHSGLGAWNKVLYLNLTDGVYTQSEPFNGTTPTSSVFELYDSSTTNASGGSYVAYVWSEVANFSKFGSYTGNGSSSGPTVTTGFKPKFILMKRTDASGYNWVIFDAERNAFDERIYPNSSSAGATGITAYSVNSDGFTVNTSDTVWNANGGTYIYAAYADRPGNNWTPNNLSADDGVTTVDQASGGKPIQVTTDTFGKTLGSGINNDSNASSLTVCMPLTSQGSLSITDDVSPTGRTVSAKTITNSNAVANTTYYQYYGGSTAFNGSTSKLTTTADSDFTFGTGDFTVEAWLYQTSDNSYPTVLEIGNHLGTSGIIFLTRSSGQAKIYSGSFVGTATFALNQWNHVAWVRASGVLNIYVNGVLGSSDAFTNNLTSTTGGVTFGTTHSTSTGGYMFPGYMQDIRIYKGAAKYTSAFTVPGRNESVAINNDSLVDSPSNAADPTDTGVGNEVTGNYATLNPLQKGSLITLSNGNLEFSAATGSGSQRAWGTVGVSTGKWYFEYTQASGTYTQAIGIKFSFDQNNSDNYLYNGNNGQKINASGSASSYGATWANNDVVGVAFDLDAGAITFYKNGVSQGVAFTGITASTYFPFVLGWSGGAFAGNLNFGQRAFAYAAPSGYKSLNTANLPTPTIADGSKYFDTKLWSGNATARSISTDFAPGFVWTKLRNTGNNHKLFDIVRGVEKRLESSTTNAEATESGTLTAFNSDGFSLGTAGNVNGNGYTYVGWSWTAGANSNNTYTVTVSGGKFYIDGVQQPTLTLAEGSTYKFDQADSTNSSHPLRFSTTSDGTHGGGSEYTTGVTTAGTPGSAGAFTQIVIAASAPTLYAYCTNHSGMGFQVNTSDKGGFTIPAGSLNSTAYDQSQTWSSGVSGSIWTSQSATRAFDGDLSTFVAPASNTTLTWTPPSTLSISSSLRVYATREASAVDLTVTFSDSSTQSGFLPSNNTAGWYTVPSAAGKTLSTISWTATNQWVQLFAVEVDGKILVNTGLSVTNVPSIASQVMASPESGFSIVSYNAGLTSSGSESIGHGLNAAPALIIGKDRDDGTHAWRIRPFFLNDNAYDYLEFDTGALAQFNSNDGTMSLPTSATFDVNWNSSVGASNDIIAYCFAPVAGYSAMGSYTGTGTSGIFVHTGMSPSWIIIKDTTNSGTNWLIFDSERDPHNLASTFIRANDSGSEIDNQTANGSIDFLSNGFTVRASGTSNTNTTINVPNSTVVWMAFAKNPFASNGGLAR